MIYITDKYKQTNTIMLVHIYRLFVLFVCGYLNHKVIISPNHQSEMGTKEGDQPFEGGEAGKHNIVRICQTSIMLLLSVYNANHYLYFLNYTEILLVLVLVLGYIMRIKCFSQLGHMFTFGLGIRKDHQLIKTGMYTYLVHPSYTAQFMVHYSYWALLLLGSNLLFNVMFVLLILYSLYMLRYRTRLEEQMMMKRFGKEYKEYMSSRYRFIPYLI